MGGAHCLRLVPNGGPGRPKGGILGSLELLSLPSNLL